jgi:hypothetical protein
LAVLSAPSFFRVFRLQRAVPELAVVADSFHTKPLRHFLQSVDRYQVLGLSRGKIELFEGNRDTLDRIDPAEGVPRTMTEALGDELTDPHHTVASYGGVGGSKGPMHHGHGGKKDEVDLDAERFFRAIDRAVLEHHSKMSGLPLAEVAEAAAGGRVATLLIEAEREIAGRIDRTTGQVQAADLSHPQVDDLLDDLGELVETKGGEVQVLPAERMPTHTGLAAVYRH